MPTYVDALERDKPINNQKFACLSFVSPEDVIESKNQFFFREFVSTWEINKSLDKYRQFLQFISYKHEIDLNELLQNLDEFVDAEKDSLKNSSFSDDYKNFVDENEEILNEKYSKMNDFQTSVRGIKVRGCYGSMEEAELRCKMIRETDPNFDVYVAEVGAWVPFHPQAYKTGRVEYLEEELNQLMHEKIKNENNAKNEFDKRVLESKRKAMQENISLASKTNNRLTQTIDENGNLIGVKNMNTQEKSLNENSSKSDIYNELFNTKDIPDPKGSRKHPGT